MAQIIAFPRCREASDKNRDREIIPARSAEILFFLGVRYVRDAEGDIAATHGDTAGPTPAKPNPASRRRAKKSA